MWKQKFLKFGGMKIGQNKDMTYKEAKSGRINKHIL